MKSALILSLLLTAVPVRAENQEKGEKGPCKADVQRFCAGIEAGGGRINDCLQSHENELSEGCKASKRMVRADMKDDMIDACKADAQALCPGKEPGTGLGMCLKENREKLSSGCLDMIKNMREMRKEHRMDKNKKKGDRAMAIPEPCQADAQALCAGKTPGKGLWVCMKENKDKLSAGCSETMMKRKH